MQTSLSRFLRRNSISLEKSLHFLTGGKSLPGSCCVRRVYAEWGHPQSYSQTLRSVPSVVTILKSLNFLGSARQFCYLLSPRPLPATLLHCGGPFCGWRPWNLGDGIYVEHTSPASAGDRRLGLLCSVWSICFLSSRSVMESFGFWCLSHFLYHYGTVLFLFFQCPFNGVPGGRREEGVESCICQPEPEARRSHCEWGCYSASLCLA